MIPPRPERLIAVPAVGRGSRPRISWEKGVLSHDALYYGTYRTLPNSVQRYHSPGPEHYYSSKKTDSAKRYEFSTSECGYEGRSKGGISKRGEQPRRALDINPQLVVVRRTLALPRRRRRSDFQIITTTRARHKSTAGRGAGSSRSPERATTTRVRFQSPARGRSPPVYLDDREHLMFVIKNHRETISKLQEE